MARATTRLVLILIVFVSKTMVDRVFGEKILCWKKVKTGEDKKLNDEDFDKYILPAYNDVTSCCESGGVGTTAYRYPWDKHNTLSRDPKLCDQVKNCNEEKSCRCERTCERQPVRKVCGSDGQTYQNKCELFDAACKQKQTIKIAYQGICKAYCKNVKCPKGHSCIFDQNGTSHCIERNCHCTPAGGKICGLDNKTYETKCHLQRAECKNHRVIPVKYYEPCDEQKTCKDITCKKGEACVSMNNGQPNCIKCCQQTKSAMKFKLCGSNGKRYDNWCALRSDSCATGKMITVDFQPNKCQQNQKKAPKQPK